MYPKSAIFNLNQIMSVKGYWTHTNRGVVHVGVVEVAIRTIHIEHVSIAIATVIPIRRLSKAPIIKINPNIII